MNIDKMIAKFDEIYPVGRVIQYDKYREIGSLINSLRDILEAGREPNPPVPSSECEHHYRYGTARVCTKCLHVNMFSEDATPSDEPKLPKLPKNWGKIKTPDGRIVDFETMKEDEPELTTNNSQVTNKPSECEHEWEDSKVWETHNTCKKCFVMVHKPTPSDEPKEAPHTKECNDRCKRDNHVTWTCHVEPTISISRTTIEDAAQQLEASGKQIMAEELRRAIGKGKV